MTTELSNTHWLDGLSSIPCQLVASTWLPRDALLQLLTGHKRFRWDLSPWETEPRNQPSFVLFLFQFSTHLHPLFPHLGSQSWKLYAMLLQWKEVFVHGFPTYCLLCHKHSHLSLPGGRSFSHSFLAHLLALCSRDTENALVFCFLF